MRYLISLILLALSLFSTADAQKVTVGPSNISSGTANVTVTPTSGGQAIGTTVTLSPCTSISGCGTNSVYTIVAADNTKAVPRANTVTQIDQIPQAGGSFPSGFSFGYSTATVGNTLKSTTSTINGIAGATGIFVPPQAEIGCNSDGTNWFCQLGMPQPATQTGTTVLYDNGWAAAPVGGGTIIANSIGGCTLSNDGVAPNTKLDISACTAADSTNSAIISAAAFTKTTGGAWTAGTGNNGMGNGLTVAASTWYHVCAANNSGAADYYFDTSVSCANRPAGISDTKVRRIGSIKTDGSVFILAFKQRGDVFNWAAAQTDANNQSYTSTPTLVTLSTPPNVASEARVSVFINTSGTPQILLVYNPDTSSSSAGFAQCAESAASPAPCGVLPVLTNTSAQIDVAAVGAGTIPSTYIDTIGYRDFRGN